MTSPIEREPRRRARGIAPPDVSIVIPVHKVEDYVEECLRSIQAQTLGSWEAIVVNDASPDGSQAIIDRLAAEDGRIRSIVLTTNIGQGFARNKGLDVARGRFVAFLDSDDFFCDPGYLKAAVECADRSEADIVRGRKQIQDERSGGIVHSVDAAEVYFPEEATGQSLLTAPELLQNNHIWNLLYRREMLEREGIRFDLTQWEERPFLLEALLAAERVSYIDRTAVMYRVRKGSTARRKKTIVDVTRREQNFQLCLEKLRAHGAHHPGSEMADHYAFCVSRWLVLLTTGFHRDHILGMHSQTDRREALSRLRALFIAAGLPAHRLDTRPAQIDDERFRNGYYHLLYTALLEGELDVVEDLLEQRAPARVRPSVQSQAGGAAVVEGKDATGRSGDKKPKNRALRKLRKLARDPAAFFADSKLGPLHALGMALRSKRKGK